jgi:putative hemolysin
VLNAFGKRSVAESPVSEEEINVLIEEGTRAGVFMPSEQEMVAEVLRLSDRTVSEIMTPRKQVTWLDIQKSLEENLRKVMTSIHNYYPVADGTLDHVLGIVNAKDLLVRKALGQTFDLAGCMHHALVVPENKTAMAALELFRESGNHIALVVDEYGTMLGIITVYDIIEAIVGELPTAGVKPRWQATQREDGSWLIDGMAPVDEFKDMFELKHLAGEETALYHTLGGFVTHVLEHIPAVAEHFEWGGLRFEIVDMDRYRVDKVLVSRITAREESELPAENQGTEQSNH